MSTDIYVAPVNDKEGLIVRKIDSPAKPGPGGFELPGVEIFVSPSLDGEEARHPTDTEWAEHRAEVLNALDKAYGLYGAVALA